MRRWIAGLEPKALPFALVCNILTLLMGVSIATVLVARAQETTNGNAGSIPIISAVCFVAIVVVLWYLSKGRLWARLVISVLSFIAIVFRRRSCCGDSFSKTLSQRSSCCLPDRFVSFPTGLHTTCHCPGTHHLSRIFGRAIDGHIKRFC